jgi:hypothetical protein
MLNKKQFSSLYHGSIEDIKEGEIITPRVKHGWADATESLEEAITHTKNRLISGLGKGNERKDVAYGKVYEVEPLPNDPSMGPATGSGILKTVSSKKGFKVKKQIVSVLKNA